MANTPIKVNPEQIVKRSLHWSVPPAEVNLAGRADGKRIGTADKGLSKVGEETVVGRNPEGGAQRVLLTDTITLHVAAGEEVVDLAKVSGVAAVRLTPWRSKRVRPARSLGRQVGVATRGVRRDLYANDLGNAARRRTGNSFDQHPALSRFLPRKSGVNCLGAIGKVDRYEGRSSKNEAKVLLQFGTGPVLHPICNTGTTTPKEARFPAARAFTTQRFVQQTVTPKLGSVSVTNDWPAVIAVIYTATRSLPVTSTLAEKLDASQ